MAFLSGVHCPYRCHHNSCPNTEGTTNDITNNFTAVLNRAHTNDEFAPFGPVLVFDRNLRLGDDIEFHAFAPLEASRRVTNGIPLGWPLSDRFTL